MSHPSFQNEQRNTADLSGNAEGLSGVIIRSAAFAMLLAGNSALYSFRANSNSSATSLFARQMPATVLQLY
jgi:hypothetical protein